MIKRLVRHGNGAAVIIDKPILEVLHLTIDTPLEITSDVTNIVVSLQRIEEELLNASLNRINDRFGIALARIGE